MRIIAPCLQPLVFNGYPLLLESRAGAPDRCFRLVSRTCIETTGLSPVWSRLKGSTKGEFYDKYIFFGSTKLKRRWLQQLGLLYYQRWPWIRYLLVAPHWLYRKILP